MREGGSEGGREGGRKGGREGGRRRENALITLNVKWLQNLKILSYLQCSIFLLKVPHKLTLSYI